MAAANTILLQPVLSCRPTTSFVVPMALMSRLTQPIHYCFGLPRFLLPCGTISSVFRPTYSWSRLLTCSTHLNLAFLHLSVMFSTLSLSFLMASFRTCSLSVLLHVHLHIFMSVTSRFFTWVVASHWHCLHPVQNSWLDDHIGYIYLHMCQ